MKQNETELRDFAPQILGANQGFKSMSDSKSADIDLAGLLKQRFGHDRFLPNQEDVIRNVLARRDSLVLMPTGGGKSICYQLPAVLLDGVALVVSPLIALMKDQVDALRSKGVRAAFINSTMTQAEVSRRADGRLPGSPGHPLRRPGTPGGAAVQRLSTRRNAEPHRPSTKPTASPSGATTSGPTTATSRRCGTGFPNTPVIALPATATERVREDILHQLRMSKAERFTSSFNRPNLTYKVTPKRRSFEQLDAMLRKLGDGSAIVYCFSRKDTEDVASRLSGKGFRALPYHAGLEDDVRRQTQERFISGEIPIIVATIAFGMGVDKPNIRLVVHYDLPKTIEGYFQETGRAGRDGKPSECVLFFSYRDKMKQDYFIDQIEDASERASAKARLAKMVEYGSGKSCRRRYLLDVFRRAIGARQLRRLRPLLGERSALPCRQRLRRHGDCPESALRNHPDR